MEIKNAIIDSVSLGRICNGIPSAYLYLRYGSGVAQGFGGYCLGGDAMAIFVLGVLDVVGCDEWEKLPGTSIRVKSDWDKIYAIGNFLDDKWFDPKQVFESMKQRDSENPRPAPQANENTNPFIKNA